MDTNLFPYEIVSIEGQRYEGEASLINLKLSDGEIGIMKDHLPLVGIIAISHLTCIKNKEQKIFAISGGILNVTKKNDEIIISLIRTELSYILKLEEKYMDIQEKVQLQRDFFNTHKTYSIEFRRQALIKLKDLLIKYNRSKE